MEASSFIAGFFAAILLMFSILVVAAFRRRVSTYNIKRSGQNSVENVGETVIAVVSNGEKKHVIP